MATSLHAGTSAFVVGVGFGLDVLLGDVWTSTSGQRRQRSNVCVRLSVLKAGCSERVEVHTERRGVIYSPSWPLNYPAGVNCSWHIQGAQGEVITIR